MIRVLLRYACSRSVRLFYRCIRMNRFAWNRNLKHRLKYLVVIFVLFICYMFGVFTHFYEKDFSQFTYPLEGDIIKFVEQLKKNQKADHEFINNYNHTFIYSAKKKCVTFEKTKFRLVYIVKSAMKNFNRRLAIRHSWGYERRFSDVPIRTVFLLGVSSDKELQRRVDEESESFGDIVQANFTDTYYNNTIKTMMGFTWAAVHCPNSQFYVFGDDDFYFSTKNVLRFVRNPTHYPEYLQLPIVSLKDESIDNNNNNQNDKKPPTVAENVNNRQLSQVLDYQLPDNVNLYTGYVFVSSPHRHFTSKWYVSLQEYPYHLWPPYVAAGAYIVSHETMLNIYYGSFFTKHFRFDDIYVGIIAKKLNIEPFHCSEFYFYKKDYNKYNYKYTLASHGYDDPEELLRIWNEQRSSGNA